MLHPTRRRLPCRPGWEDAREHAWRGDLQVEEEARALYWWQSSLQAGSYRWCERLSPAQISPDTRPKRTVEAGALFSGGRVPRTLVDRLQALIDVGVIVRT